VASLGSGERLVPKLLVQIVAMLAVFGGLLFGAAGDLGWTSGWAYLVWFGLLTLAVSLWLARVDPGLLAERMKPVVQRGQKSWDRLFIGFVGIAYMAWLILMAIDARRLAWSNVPLAVQGLGAVLILASFAGIARVYRENSFAAPVIKLQAERQQTVISTGPYALVRHPMYAFGILQLVGAPLMLGSWWGLIALPPIILAIAIRALGEERMLRADLDGYEDYARRVRWRFAPGLW
jgi:protein-S-isoprenylcysteine O-methyltransferase Ste14